jgi:hypothetical protein
MTSSTVLPETFSRAVEDLRAVRPRAEIAVEEVPPPRRLAPFAYAVSAAVLRQREEVASGRLILLHDPDGHEAWGPGTLRLVTYVNAELEADLAADPLLPTVGWSWLVDALETHEAPYAALGGTVTQTTSTRFGELSTGAGGSTADLELRASWTPLGGELGVHMRAWCALLASTAGLPPPGVTALRAH